MRRKQKCQRTFTAISCHLLALDVCAERQVRERESVHILIRALSEARVDECGESVDDEEGGEGVFFKEIHGDQLEVAVVLPKTYNRFPLCTRVHLYRQ